MRSAGLRARIFLPQQTIDDLDHHKMWTENILSEKPQASSAIMTNNIIVCFITFAGGITAGLWTLWSMFFNGLMLGVVVVVCAQHHMALSLWSFMAAHGALELPAIMLSGAAGLRIAAGILFPGMLRRRDSIALGGSEAVQLIAGTIPMLIVAGTLRGFPVADACADRAEVRGGRRAVHGALLWLGEGGRTAVQQ